jgi:streptomycin 6-kinase
VTRVRHLPFTSPDGRSGGHLAAVEAEGAAGRPAGFKLRPAGSKPRPVPSRRYVLKRISWQRDVVMRATGDRAGRAVTIWQQGLLDRLPPQIVHGVVGCAQDGDGWAILLEDFRGLMLPAHEQRLSEQQDALVLDAMAALHQTFWEEPPAPETYSLCALRAMYESLFPDALRRERHVDAPPIVAYALEGSELLPDLVEPDVAQLLELLQADISPFIAALDRYPQTLVHGDWHHGNVGIHPGRGPGVILLDWAFVGLGPPALDLAHYLFIGVMRLPSTKEATIERYRRLLAGRLSGRFDDAWWVPQLELSLLGEFLRLGWNKAQVAVHGETAAVRERERRELAWWCEQARKATRWL